MINGAFAGSQCVLETGYLTRPGPCHFTGLCLVDVNRAVEEHFGPLHFEPFPRP